LDYVYASPLLRARATGEAVHSKQAHNPPFALNPKLREQHFGIAEGNKWTLEWFEGRTLEEYYAQKLFPVLTGRDEKFPGGESLRDLAKRADEGIAECVLSNLHEDGVHIAIASHGLCISELIAAIIRLDPEARRDTSYTGLLNTAWTRLQITPREPISRPLDISDRPSCRVVVTHVNVAGHLATIKDIPDEPIDEETAKARAFFGGAQIPPATVPETNAEVVKA